MSKKNLYRDKIIWVDLEMTGLDPARDKILELALIVTDWQLQELAKLELVFRQSELFLRRKFKASFWQEHKATAAALFKQNQNGCKTSLAEAELVKFVQMIFDIKKPSGDIILAGNTIRADRAFIDKYLPEFAKYLHYRMLDVSSFKVLFDARYGKIFPKPEEHRALGDIRGSIAELKYFMQFIKDDNVK